MATRFTPDDSIVSVDDDSGDAVVYAGGGVASRHRGQWRPRRGRSGIVVRLALPLSVHVDPVQ
jgi:hypothetical protein